MNELATRTEGNDALDIAQHIGQMLSLGQTLVKSKLLPNGVNSPEAAVAIILKGRELGIPPMQALSHIHVISGKPTLSAELMMAMMLEAGHDVWIGRTDNQACTVKGIRRGKKREQELTFTIEDAEAAGVMNNPTWKKYKAAMLRARAISAFARMFAPDVLMGASYTPEELGAQVDADGEIVDVQVRVERDTPPAKVEEPQKATTPAEKPQEAKQQDDGQFPPEDDMPESLSGQSEPEKEAPVTISAKKAKDLGTKLAELGTPAKDHVQLARDATGRDDIEALTDLNTKEALLVYKFANGETVEIPSGTEVAA